MEEAGKKRQYGPERTNHRIDPKAACCNTTHPWTAANTGGGGHRQDHHHHYKDSLHGERTRYRPGPDTCPYLLKGGCRAHEGQGRAAPGRSGSTCQYIPLLLCRGYQGECRQVRCVPRVLHP